MIPGGPKSEREMQTMMRRLGMKTESVEGVEEVVVRTRDKEHFFRSPEVTILTVQGIRTYQVVGTAEIRTRTKTAEVSVSPPKPEAVTPSGPPEEDILLVMEQAGASRERATEALEFAGGAPAEAILRILSRRGTGDP